MELNGTLDMFHAIVAKKGLQLKTGDRGLL